MKSSLCWILLAAAFHLTWSAAIEPKAGQKSMVCYYGSWAVYRPGNGKFDVENIDPFLCTHIIYGFNGLGVDSTMIPLDPWNDLYDNYGKGAFLRFTGLKSKNPALKALIAIGGWNEGSEKYSRMVADPAKRAKFVNSVVNFLIKYNFDGLDFDWEYPANRGGVEADKVNYISMIRELKNAFAPYGFLLTAAVSSGKGTIDTAYDMPAMGGILDQIHVMSYDYHGSWETVTGHNAPLFANPKYDLFDNQLLNVNWTINYWISSGVPRSKILLGIPLYGRGFTLSSSSNNGFYASAPSPIPAGPYTQQAGTWGYNEIREKLNSEPGWVTVTDPCYLAPYAYKGNLWIGYDDEQSVRLKGQYIAAMGLGGALTWSIETDDFRGVNSGGVPFILTKTVVEAMNGPTNLMPTNPCLSGSEVSTPTPIISTPLLNSSTPISTRAPDVTPVSTTTPPTTTTTASSSVCKKAGLNPDPYDCGIFYQCVSGSNGWIIYTQRCAPGTVFNPSISGCDYAQNVPGC